VPGLSGYGVETLAGRGGRVYRVTSLAASGAGTLKECVGASGPRVCVFEISGVIALSGDLNVWNPYLTIAGQTAPPPGIMLRNGALSINASDVLVQHIHVRAGDSSTGMDAGNRDAMKIEAAKGNPTIERIVIDHCSFAWGLDETGSAYQNYDNLTLNANIYGPPLNNSDNPKGAHGYAFLTGPARANVTMTGNLMVHGVSRNPLSNNEHLIFLNNVVYDWVNMATDLQGQLYAPTYNTVQGNVYKEGPNTAKRPPIDVRADDTKIMPGSKVYVRDNGEGSGDPWSMVRELNGNIPDDYKASAVVDWNKGGMVLPTASSTVYNAVLASVGAFPAFRDSVDARTIDEVKKGTGAIINCVSPDGTARCADPYNAGGWPSYAVNRRALTLPSDPNTVTPSGYTNLELWLQQMAAEVEGRGKRPSPPRIEYSGRVERIERRVQP